MNAKKWAKVGAVLSKKDNPKDFYMKVEQDIPAGSIIRMERPKDRIERLVELGHLDREKADERLNKIPDFVKFELILPPPKNDDKF
ncbi:hypothetical protein UFOVP1351_39 [uncultured Caudovirales phage]|uniref:Uncharacterized protein n=1 Tax=uncultured Caudovirales phage TaxID=2100421 RepID=A0A6J5RWR1_9CAUD|nr:hypothetical protein UFOVP1351_39 [uncultured Caudovirales phage]